MARASSSQTTSERATMSTSSPDYGSDRDFDVFLNFRGPDSRYTVVDVLYQALIRAGIHVFYDDEDIRKGEVIEGELLSAITNSKIYITIFSKDYASSRWCLRELAKIMECRRNSSEDETQKVILPIFCDVNVSEDLKLRSQVYISALEKHKIEQGETVAKSWEDALKDVAKIKGWNLRDHGLDKLRKLIVDEVCGKLSIRSEAQVPDDFIGIHKPVEDIMKLLDQGTSDVRFVIIHGMGGIGKTTLAKLVFKQISFQFQGRCIFLSDVHESSCPAGGIENLQQKLLHEILDLSSLHIHDACDGANMIKQKLKDKKVLIVLDNLNNVEQLEKLAGSSSWFGVGSRIIITTRNIDYLVEDGGGPDDDNVPITVKREGYEFYKMELMKYDDALKLFSRLAFKSDSPPLDYYDISKKVVDTTGRLPLAVRVIGLLLRHKGKKTWEAKLRKLKKVAHKDVLKTLAISFKDLDDDEKEIFLDIACLFINKEKTYATYYWEAQRLFPNSGINVLVNMSLIEIVDGNKLWMHDLLRDLGRSIVEKEDKSNPGRRSRLWLPEEALKVVQKKKGTEAIIALRLGIIEASCSFTHEQFAKLTSLNFLELDGGNFAYGEFNEVFSELIWLSWDNCPLEIQAINSSFKNLVVLKLSGSQITDNWGGWGPIMEAKQLKVLNLIGCTCLAKTPNFSTFLKLERLILEDCHGLKEIHKSISELKSLMVLRISSVRLTELPCSIKELDNLKCLYLRCSQLKSFPYSDGKLMSLVELDISYSGIKELPNSIGELKRLKILRMSGFAMSYIPDSIGRLESLNELHMQGTSITMLPETIGNLRRLKILNLSMSYISKLPKALGNLENLEELHVESCFSMDGKLPEEIGELSCLRILNLEATTLSEVPATINQLSHLEKLTLGEFYQPFRLPALPTSLRSLEVKFDSLELRRIPDLSNMTNLVTLKLCNECIYSKDDDLTQRRWQAFSRNIPRLDEIEWLVRLVKLEELRLVLPDLIFPPSDLSSLSQLEDLEITCFNPQSLFCLPSNLKRLTLHDVKSKSEWQFFSGLNNLYFLELHKCMYRKIQVDGLGQLKNLHLHRLVLDGCVNLKTLSNLSCLKKLEDLLIRRCPRLVDIQGLGEMESLESLSIWKCGSIKQLPDLSSLKKLVDLSFSRCDSLESIPHVHGETPCRLVVSGCKHFDDYYGGTYKKLEPRGALRSGGTSKERRGDGGKSRIVVGSGRVEMHQLYDEDEDEMNATANSWCFCAGRKKRG